MKQKIRVVGKDMFLEYIKIRISVNNETLG